MLGGMRSGRRAAQQFVRVSRQQQSRMFARMRAAMVVSSQSMLLSNATGASLLEAMASDLLSCEEEEDDGKDKLVLL
ncbi:MAG: hypothetical protein MHM6MM_004480 [Cercozoa sp. M6MM]